MIEIEKIDKIGDELFVTHIRFKRRKDAFERRERLKPRIEEHLCKLIFFFFSSKAGNDPSQLVNSLSSIRYF
jgi:uncharacterized protein (DUF488 family)